MIIRGGLHAAALEEYMDCPTCTGTQLLMTNREGIEIDYCPKCRGVWLDRGELDKIIERSHAGAGNPVGSQLRDDGSWWRDDDDDDDEYRHHGDYRGDRRHDPRSGYPQKKKRGFFGDLFDFGD